MIHVVVTGLQHAIGQLNPATLVSTHYIQHSYECHHFYLNQITFNLQLFAQAQLSLSFYEKRKYKKLVLSRDSQSYLKMKFIHDRGISICLRQGS